MYEVTYDKGYPHVGFPYSDAEASFDLTNFPDSETFREIVEEFDLQYQAVQGTNGRLDIRKFVWHNDEVVVVTAANPITGEYRGPGRVKGGGYASYIGIEGSKEAVVAVFHAIRERAQSIKDFNRTDREFI